MVKKQVNADAPAASTMTTTREDAPQPSKAPKAPPASPRKKSSSSSSNWLLATSLLALVLTVGVGVGVGHQLDHPSPAALQLQRLARRVASTVQSLSVQIETIAGTTPDKYKTDVVFTQMRVLLDNSSCGDTAYTPALLLSGRKTHVTDAMDGPSLGGTDKIFFMLNGANEGLYVSWNKDFGCVAVAARKAAQWLGADQDEISNGVRLYTQMGHPIRDAQELKASGHLVHILLDFQLWQWPGIRKGYQYVLENGVVLTTVGLSPKVLDVQHFLTQREADQVRAIGEPTLNRSKVDGENSSTVVSSSRTSHTAFLPDDAFTRDFRRRSALVARLPSASYAERLQLVRYGAGEFYRQHLDTFHSREFLPKNSGMLTMDDYKNWAKWARETLTEMADDSRIPAEFKSGGKLFPDEDDEITFPNALLDVFYDHAVATNYFTAHSDNAWKAWIRRNADKNAQHMMPSVMKEDGRPHYLPLAVRAWEEKLGLPELRYTFPKKQAPLNGVTHLFHWVRWAKERISFLGDRVPSIARPEGELFPKYTVAFQSMLLDFVLDDYSAQLITEVTNPDWYQWLVRGRGHAHMLFQAVQSFPHLMELAIRSWEARVQGGQELHYELPKWVRHFHPQRYVTLFIYLNNETKIGGETVFPYSLDRFSDEAIERTGMSECSSGLAVPPLGLHASLFYVQTPEGEIDKMSRHGGCPPHEGVKWGSNSFMWNADADEGTDFWTTELIE